MCIGFQLPFTLKTVQGALFSNKYNDLRLSLERKKIIFQTSGDNSQEAIGTSSKNVNKAFILSP